MNLVVAIVFAVLAIGCTATHHPTRPSSLGVARSSDELVAVLDRPGPIALETVESADWEVPLSGLLNLEHRKAKAAGLVDRPEPITVRFHVIEHPQRGRFIVDTGSRCVPGFGAFPSEDRDREDGSTHRGRLAADRSDRDLLLLRLHRAPRGAEEDDANPDDYIGVLIPGGAKSPAILAQSLDVLRFIQAIDGAGKLVASICRGSLLAAKSGIAKGRRITGFHLADQFPDLVIQPVVGACGGIWVEDQPAVVDRNLISSRHPDDVDRFVAAIQNWIDDLDR